LTGISITRTGISNKNPTGTGILPKFQVGNGIGTPPPPFRTLPKRQPMRLEIRHLKRHQKRRARVQHHLIQELNKIAKTFRIFLALQICFVR
jgi:hypothetical protein